MLRAKQRCSSSGLGTDFSHYPAPILSYPWSNQERAAGSLEQFLDKFSTKAAGRVGVPDTPVGPSTFSTPRCSGPRVTAPPPRLGAQNAPRRCAGT